MSRTAVFVQARLASQRLPEKALLPLAGRSVITHVMEALSGIQVEEKVLVTDEQSALRLQREAAASGYELFAGHPDDVLERFCCAAERFDVDVIIRATGDNPFTSRTAATAALDLFRRSGADYAGITGTPYGTGVEVLSVAALQDVRETTDDRFAREHVSPGLYQNPEKYRIVTEAAPMSLTMPDLRVTLDTPSDYEYIADIYREIYRGVPIEIPELIAYGQRNHKNSA